MRLPERSPVQRGRVRKGTAVLAVAVAVAGLAAIGVWPRADAAPSEVEALTTICASPGGLSRKLIAIEALCNIDSSAARDEVIALAGSRDDRVAVAAIGALCREDFARDTIEEVYEDTSRSDAARMAAQIAYCRLHASDGDSWADVKRYVKTTAEDNPRLSAQWAGLKAKHWAAEVDSE